ncbi:MAG: UvrD-helicase domain-containing protein [Bacteroidales bacterium]|nr:UvrD-helicase domain-containing protein [Bacteroidales bacterium]
MKILKASAGSGKTYRLSHAYVDELLASREPYPYRHILAVTFTNKATAEMKNRILKVLAEKAETDDRARALLTDLLHDYGAFSVSTIDRFFQQAMKAFSREIGQFADYQIELDKDSLIAETMDRILDSLTEDSEELLLWIRSALQDTLESGRKYAVDDGLLETGRLLRNDEFRKLAERYGISGKEAFAKERLGRIREDCRAKIKGFEAQAAALGFPLEPGKPASPKNKAKLIKATPGLAELFDEPYRIYCTAWILDKLIFQLGLAGEFYREFDALLAEKNVMCLDESNILLRDIIAGSDAPFVYEKLGVRYDHFLLDEFQDTSRIQWDNFLPLLRESESRGGHNLVVGDVKQSIYRWRDSDWELLGGEILKTFPDADVETMQDNWRSARTVVLFNNRFFAYAAAQTGLPDIYADVQQTPKTEEAQAGSVQVSFTDDQPAAVLASVLAARDAGAKWGDIAVLVRSRKKGALLASTLIGAGIPVVSDDSLLLKSSPVVRRLVSLLSCYENPDDEIGRFLADSMDLEFPKEYHSLVDFCEQLLRAMRAWDPASFEGQVPFIQAFMDDLQAWVQVYGNNLRYYLRHWEEKELYIVSPENDASVRILTIHKSKGLEFPYVIFPYADEVKLYKPDVHWSRLDTERTPFGPEADGIYPVDLTGQAGTSLFAAAVERERHQQLVDNINLFYVAFTRAAKCLHVIAKQPSQKVRGAVQRGKTPEFGNFAEILFAFLRGADTHFAGEPYDFRRMEREEAAQEKDFPGAYPSCALDGRLRPSQDAADFFGEDGKVGTEASSRLRGIVLHDILSQVKVPADLDAAVARAVQDGQLDTEGGKLTLALLRDRIAARPEWFPPAGPGVEILNEQELFDTDGSVHRPDRVIVHGREVRILDYKFLAWNPEEERKYKKQIDRYSRLWTRLGYEVTEAALWFFYQEAGAFVDRVVRFFQEDTV